MIAAPHDCPCGVRLNAISGDGCPGAGDVTICINCLRVYTFDTKLNHVPASVELTAEIHEQLRLENSK